MRALLQHSGIACNEVAIYFVGKKRISELHRIYFNDLSPTDCISFPLDSPDDASGYTKKTSKNRAPVRARKLFFPSSSGYTHLGEIFICPKIAIEYVAKEKGNVYEEVTLYLVHGFLHLLGYDDMSYAERKKMRAEEKKLMRFLRASKAVVSS
jgi:probable rRNA maturation factor